MAVDVQVPLVKKLLKEVGMVMEDYFTSNYVCTYLFGSFATGSYDGNSDIDFTVLVRDMPWGWSANKKYYEVIDEIMCQAGRKLEYDIRAATLYHSGIDRIVSCEWVLSEVHGTIVHGQENLKELEEEYAEEFILALEKGIDRTTIS